MGVTEILVSKVTRFLISKLPFCTYFESNFDSYCHRVLYVVKKKRNLEKRGGVIVPSIVVMNQLDSVGVSYKNESGSKEVNLFLPWKISGFMSIVRKKSGDEGCPRPRIIYGAKQQR